MWESNPQDHLQLRQLDRDIAHNSEGDDRIVSASEFKKKAKKKDSSNASDAAGGALELGLAIFEWFS